LICRPRSIGIDAYRPGARRHSAPRLCAGVGIRWEAYRDLPGVFWTAHADGTPNIEWGAGTITPTTTCGKATWWEKRGKDRAEGELEQTAYDLCGSVPAGSSRVASIVTGIFLDLR
jgi:hypothetical protein